MAIDDGQVCDQGLLLMRAVFLLVPATYGCGFLVRREVQIRADVYVVSGKESTTRQWHACLLFFYRGGSAYYRKRFSC